MPAPSAPAYQPAPYRAQAAAHVSDLIQRRGDIEAQRLAQPGGSVADLVGGIANMTTGIMDRNRAAQTAHAKKMRVAQILGSGQPFDAAAIVNEFGIEGAKEIYAIYEVEEKRKQAQAEWEAKQAERAKKASDEKNALGMRQFAKDAIRGGTSPTDVNLELYSEGQPTLPAAAVPDPKVVSEEAAKRKEAALAQFAADALRQGTPVHKINVDLLGEGAKPLDSGDFAPEESNTKSQSASFMLNGQQVEGDYVPGEGGKPGRYFFNGQDVTGRAVPLPRAQGGRGAGGLTEGQEFSMTERLATGWLKAVSPVREMDRQLRVMDTGLKRFRAGDKNGGSQAVLVTFQKILDPDSVVRESEYARTTQGQAMLDRIEGYMTRLAQGGTTLTDRELAAMVETAREMTTQLQSMSSGTRRRIEAQIEKYGFDPATVFDDVLVPTQPGAAPPARQGGPGTTGTAPGGGFRILDTREK